nr:hypothetical protein [Sphingomonas glacialis]
MEELAVRRIKGRRRARCRDLHGRRDLQAQQRRAAGVHCRRYCKDRRQLASLTLGRAYALELASG